MLNETLGPQGMVAHSKRFTLASGCTSRDFDFTTGIFSESEYERREMNIDSPSDEGTSSEGTD